MSVSKRELNKWRREAESLRKRLGRLSADLDVDLHHLKREDRRVGFVLDRDGDERAGLGVGITQKGREGERHAGQRANNHS